MTPQAAFDPAALLRAMFDAAVAAAQPARCLPPHLPAAPARGRLIVVGAGKASAEMAQVAEAHYRRQGVAVEGLVITRYGHGLRTKSIRVVEAGHPVPDEAGERAAREIAINQKSEVFIHGENGRIRERNSYGNDPFPPKG